MILIHALVIGLTLTELCTCVEAYLPFLINSRNCLIAKVTAYFQETHLTNLQLLLHHQVQGLKLLSFPGAVR